MIILLLWPLKQSHLYLKIVRKYLYYIQRKEPQSNKQLYIKRIAYGGTQEDNHLYVQYRDQAQILLQHPWIGTHNPGTLTMHF